MPIFTGFLENGEKVTAEWDENNECLASARQCGRHLDCLYLISTTTL